MHLSERTIQLAYFGIPAIVFVGFRFFSGGPQESLAVDQIDLLDSNILPSMIAMPKDLETRDAKVVVKGMQSQLSPFWYEESPVDPFLNALDPTENSSVGSGPFEIQVTSILPHPKRPLAVINGKARTIGAAIGSGWVLIKIDGDTRTVTLRNLDGEVQVVAISRE